VAHNERRVAAAGGTVKTVDVAATDAACADANKDVLRADIGLREIDQLQFHVFGEQKRVHMM